MEIKNRNITIKNLEIAGIFFSFISATLLHFSYDWSGGNVLSIMFGAINESVWEHIKILTIPYIFWAGLEICMVRISLKKLIIAKALGVYTIAILTIVVNMIYTLILGNNVVWLDIFLAFLWLATGYAVSERVLRMDIATDKYFTICVFLMVLFIVMLLSFTINPPHIGIFLDPITNTYGITRQADVGAIYLESLGK
ncbi:MAG: DUF6512 family protein [Clostridia bacterium]|nr:DUF6512 family protein [Clostridia bacterium]